MDGSILSLYAKGPQDEYLIDKTLKIQEEFEQYSDFSIDTFYFPINSQSYLGNTIKIPINIKNIPGDLLCNLFLKCTLPNLTIPDRYIESTGRALIKSITLQVNENTIEKLVDDWTIIYDDVFLDDNEKQINSSLITTDTGGPLYIPLDFFFTRRFSKTRSSNKPFFPLCAVRNQIMYVTIEFASLIEISSATTNYKEMVDIPTLVFETITLTDYERIKYETPFDLRITKYYKEPVSEFTGNFINTNLTVNFEVSAMFWFLRYKLYETNPNFFIRKYQYGYNLSMNINSQFIEPFEYTTITINNEYVSDKFSTELFYKYQQPLDHGLSTPSKSIYMYCFADKPTDYGSAECFDFSIAQSKSSNLTIKLKQELLLDVTQNYSVNVFHFGYTYIHFENGTCSPVYIF